MGEPIGHVWRGAQLEWPVATGGGPALRLDPSCVPLAQLKQRNAARDRRFALRTGERLDGASASGAVSRRIPVHRCDRPALHRFGLLVLQDQTRGSPRRRRPALGHTRPCFPEGARIRYAPPPTAGLPSRADLEWIFWATRDFVSPWPPSCSGAVVHSCSGAALDLSGLWAWCCGAEQTRRTPGLMVLAPGCPLRR